MQSSMHVMALGQTTSTAEHLRQRLASCGVACPPSFTLPLNKAVESLARLTTHPDVLFLQCAGHTGDLQDISQLRSVTETAIAAIAPMHQPRYVLDLIRAGASDCLSDNDQFQADLHGLLARLKQRQISDGRRGRIISIVSVSGGCGASTIAANLAAALAREHGTAGLVELKFDGGDLATLLNLQPQHTLIDLCQGAIDMDAEMFEKSLAQHACGVRLLAAPAPWELHAPIMSEAIERVLPLAASVLPYVVLDLEDVFHREQLAALAASDTILLVLRLEFPCLVRTKRTLGYLLEHGIPPDRVQLVVNRHGQKNELKAAQVIEALGHSIAHYLPDDYAVAASASNVGNPLVVEASSSRLAQAYMKMAHALVAK
jgi:pilus assembly protein CpaE